jgi:septal ring factor EnvC (AmiA/AmiB activator)
MTLRHGLVAIAIALALTLPAASATAQTKPAAAKDKTETADKQAEHDRQREQADAAADELEALRRESVTIAATAQQHERAIMTLEGELAALERDEAKKQRVLADHRLQQMEVLSALERLARDPPETFAAASPVGPIDRVRGGLLLAAAIPALGDEAHALKADLAALAVTRADARGKRSELITNRRALDKNRQLLVQMIARRFALEREAMPDEADIEARGGKIAEEVSDPRDLIVRLAAEAERRDRELAVRAQKQTHGAKGKALDGADADPLRPKNLRLYDGGHDALLLPVSGRIVRHWGDPDESGVPSQWLGFATVGGAQIVAPFDGRIVFAGPFHSYGLILIIEHGGGYHSVLAGLGRADVKIGQWVVAGEPVGVTPEAPAEDKSSGSTLYVELRRDGQPIDPSLLLARHDERPGNRPGDK